MAHVMKHTLDEMGGFGTRKPQVAMNDIGKVGARERARKPRLPVHPCDSQIGHLQFPSRPVCPCPIPVAEP
jgi:hypothetical protein